MKKVKKPKRCANCNRVIAGHNKSGLCSYCWKKKDNKRKWRESKV